LSDTVSLTQKTNLRQY